MILNTYLNMVGSHRKKWSGARILLVGVAFVLVYFVFLTLVGLVSSIVVTTNAIDTEYFLAHKEDFRIWLWAATGALFFVTLVTQAAYINVSRAKRYRRRSVNVPLCYFVGLLSIILGGWHGTLHILVGLGSYSNEAEERDDYPSEPRPRDRYYDSRDDYRSPRDDYRGPRDDYRSPRDDYRGPRDDYRRRPPRDERRRRYYDDEY